MRSSGRRRRPPRVVVASRLFAPEPAAASFRLLAAVRALRDAGADVTVLTSRYAEGATAPPGVKVRRWPVLRDRDGAVRGVLPYASFDGPLMLRLMAVPRPDVVLVEPPPTTGTAARAVLGLQGIPYVYYAADLVSLAAEAGGHPGVLVAIARRLERVALRGAARVVTVNEDVSRGVVSFGVPPERVLHVGNGVDADIFTSEGRRERPPRVPADSPHFVYAGSMNHVHGADVFVRAFGRVLEREPRAVLVFVGGGEDVEVIRALGARLPAGSFVMIPPVPGPRAAALLRGASAGLASVRPGSGYELALATKALATAACGTPIVFAGDGFTREVVREGNLGISTPWEPDRVAEAMLAALDSETPRDRETRAAWVRDHASLQITAQRVATAVLDVARSKYN